VFVVFALGAVLQLLRMFAESTPAPFPVIAMFCAFSLVVTFLWGRWWYAQREYFHD
jgi:hypothetical protein